MENVLALIQAGDIEAAENELNQNQQSGNPDWHVSRSLLMEAKGEIDEAITALEKARDLQPDHADALFHCARMLDLHGCDSDALDLYEQLAQRKPAYVNGLLNLAVLYEDRGEFSRAASCVQRILAEHPNHQRAKLFFKDIESSKSMHYDEAQEQNREQQSALLETPISDFELTVRSRNCLKKMNINTLGDLLKISEAELLSYKNFGETSLEEIKALLHQKGLHIGQLKEEVHRPTRPPVRQPQAEGSPEILNKYLSEIEFSGRARKCLQRLGLVTLGDLTTKSEAELLAAKNFGQTSLNEVKQKLTEFGLSLRK
jgi:DNA-directed RNA polymerase subunit alpha